MLDKIAYRVIQLNDQVFMPHGLLMIDPAERGLRMVSSPHSSLLANTDGRRESLTLILFHFPSFRLRSVSSTAPTPIPVSNSKNCSSLKVLCI